MDFNASASEQFDELVETVHTLHQSIHELQDPGYELVALRNCADTCKIVHLLKARGEAIPARSYEQFDAYIREALEKILCGHLYEEAYSQACLGVRDSGLGLRRSGDLALPAAIASSVQSRAAIQELLSSDFAGIFPSTPFVYNDFQVHSQSDFLLLGHCMHSR